MAHPLLYCRKTVPQAKVAVSLAKKRGKMPFRLWGAAEDVALRGPTGWPAYLLLALYTLVVLLLLYRFRDTWRALDRRQWATLGLLGAAAFITSQLLAVPWNWNNPALLEQPALMAVSLLAPAPYLLAGAMLNPAAAVVVGLVSGLGRALGQTHSLFDIPQIGIAAGLAAILMVQTYRGRLFRALRLPVVAAVAGQILLAFMGGLTVMAQALPRATVLGALDLGLFVGFHSLLPLLVEGLASGALVTAIIYLLPGLQPDRGVKPSPIGRSLQNYMTASYFWFAAVLVLLSASAVFLLSTRTISQSLLVQMASNTERAADSISAMRTELTNVLVRNSGDERLVAPSANEKARGLASVHRLSPEFSQVLLVATDGLVVLSDSASGEATDGIAVADMTVLTVGEAGTVAAVLASGRPQLIANSDNPATVFSLVVPLAASGQQRDALIGRLSSEQMRDRLAQQFTFPDSASVFLVDEGSRVIGLSGDRVPLSTWTVPAADAGLLTAIPASSSDFAYQTISPVAGTRQLTSYDVVPGGEGYLVAVVPYEQVLRQALGVMAPFALLLLAASLLFALTVSTFGRSITGPITDLVGLSKSIAGGGTLENSVRVDRDDELGQLSLAFSQMQRAMKQRLDELNLLLNVSNEVAASINISQGMPAVLQGVIRGTGAAGARAVVRNPNASFPLIFSEGPSADAMSQLDRPVMSYVRRADELSLSSAAEIEAELNVSSPVASLFAIPLRSASELQGVLYVGYRQPHYFDSAESNLLRTLAGQATVLVQNAHLFSAAESGRKRLAAILSSTTNAVIVTDQTDRVLLLNPAMERAFQLEARLMAGRPVADVIESEELARNLSVKHAPQEESFGAEAVDGKLEVEVNGRTLLANIATVYSGTGQTMGRVAVLHDVTELKELDRMKADFLAGVTHDLLSPLTYMRNYTTMLPLADDTTLQQEYVDKIMLGIDRMTTLINNLVELARIDAGINLQIDNVAVPALLQTVANEYWTEAHSEGIAIAVSAPDGLPAVRADAGLLRRAVTNLVTNALKYAPNSDELRLDAHVVGDDLVIGVHDQGPGINPSDLPHLFERFYRGAQVGGSRTRGTGLGLAIVESVAMLHGGRVWCESEPGLGSTFYLALPLNGPPATST